MEWHLIVPIVAVPSYLMRSFAESVVPKDHRRSREVVKLKLQLLSWWFWLLQVVPCSDENTTKRALKVGYSGKCWLWFPMVNWPHWIPLISWGVVKQRARLEDWYGKTAPETPPLEQPIRWQVRTSQRSWQIGVPLAPEMNLLWCCGFVNSLRLLFVKPCWGARTPFFQTGLKFHYELLVPFCFFGRFQPTSLEIKCFMQRGSAGSTCEGGNRIEVRPSHPAVSIAKWGVFAWAKSKNENV